MRSCANRANAQVQKEYFGPWPVPNEDEGYEGLVCAGWKTGDRVFGDWPAGMEDEARKFWEQHVFERGPGPPAKACL